MNTYTDIFSNPKQIFEKTFKTKNNLKDNCIYILDTNVLLLPYTVGNKELSEIKRIYTDLLSNDRLLIPAQVAKEFAKNRPKKLEEINQSISDHLSRVVNAKMPQYPMFSQLPEYIKIGNIEDKINNLIKDYKNEIRRILEYIKNINWNDQVSLMYSLLFREKYVMDYNWDYKTLKEELEDRHKFNIPPAFKDKQKDDGGIGDYIIWKDILKIGTERDIDIIFVTGDEKPDWFHQSMKAKLYPRYELLHEFKEATSGKDIFFISLSDLIEIYSSNHEIIESIRSVESIKSISYERISNKLRKDAILQANSKCRLCEKDGSFDGNDGSSFLEVHHIRPLSKGGDNTIGNLIVLCPNCHKIVHERMSKDVEFHGYSPCEMSGQICPGCKIGIMDVSENGAGDGVECNICGLYIPA